MGYFLSAASRYRFHDHHSGIPPARNWRDPREERAYLKRFPQAKIDYSQASIWASLRPITMPRVVHEPMEVPTR